VLMRGRAIAFRRLSPEELQAWERDRPFQQFDRRRLFAIVEFYRRHRFTVERRWHPVWTGTRSLPSLS